MAAIQTSGLKTAATLAGTTFTFNMPSNFTAGSSVVLACASFLGGTDSITGITVNGTAMVKDGTFQDVSSNNYWVNIWRCQSVAGGGAAVVVTYSGTGGYFSGSCEEWATLSASPLDQSASGENNDAGGNLVLTTGSKAQNNELVYAVATSSRVAGGAGTMTGPASGFTQSALNNTSGFLGVAAGYKEVSASGTEAATWTVTSVDLAGLIVTYKTAGGGGGANVDDDQVM